MADVKLDSQIEKRQNIKQKKISEQILYTNFSKLIKEFKPKSQGAQ